jgi:hypothetical protein
LTVPNSFRIRERSATSSLAAKPTETAAQKFKDYANMTPAQRLQAEMMSQLGITEHQFKAMSLADQAKVMDRSGK